jgi:hypothetical protein
MPVMLLSNEKEARKVSIRRECRWSFVLGIVRLLSVTPLSDEGAAAGERRPGVRERP